MIPRTIFSAEHDAFRDTVRRFIAEQVTPYHLDWEKAGEVPRALWHKAAELGFLCCNVPEEYGGMGADFLYSTILIEEFARAGATGPTFYLHSDIVAPYLVDFGTEEQKRKWLPKMATVTGRARRQCRQASPGRLRGRNARPCIALSLGRPR
jgi:acyl-CoA dehydrogenase